LKSPAQLAVTPPLLHPPTLKHYNSLPHNRKADSEVECVLSSSFEPPNELNSTAPNYNQWIALQVWLLPQSWAASLFFPPPSSPLFTQGLKVAPEGTSPVLIFTHDRKFSIGRRVGAREPRAVTEKVDEVCLCQKGK